MSGPYPIYIAVTMTIGYGPHTVYLDDRSGPENKGRCPPDPTVPARDRTY